MVIRAEKQNLLLSLIFLLTAIQHPLITDIRDDPLDYEGP